ncbi:MAG: amidohydrolase family protein [Thermofilum sp.]
MGVIEVGTLLDWGVVRRNVRVEYEGSEDFYFETAVMPGFSDAHAHPQVVDVGDRGKWSSSYEWISRRKLRVDEGAIRRDSELSGALAKATLLLSLLDGVTLAALNGSLAGNLRALQSLRASPRVILMPTVMEAEGWTRPESVYAAYASNLAMWDGYYSMGFFAHSIRLTSPSSLRASYKIAAKLKLPFALHLSEGVDEADELVKLLEGVEWRIVAVHCITSPEKCRSYGFKIVHCPTSNLYLYGYTISELSLLDALGSDWPLVTGTVRRTYLDAVKVHGPSASLLEKATAGGYEVYGIGGKGDFVCFDEPLEKVIAGRAEPKLVAVKGRVLVKEGVVEGENLTRREVEKFKEEQVKLAFERYGV